MAHFYKNETPQTSCLGPQWLGSCRWRPLSRKCFRGSREAPLPTHTRDLGQGLRALGVGCGPPGSPELGLRGRCKGPAVRGGAERRAASWQAVAEVCGVLGPLLPQLQFPPSQSRWESLQNRREQQIFPENFYTFLLSVAKGTWAAFALGEWLRELKGGEGGGEGVGEGVGEGGR